MAVKCCDITAGQLRHTVVIQAEGPTTDAGGGQTDPWASPATVATVRAKIEPLTGFERLRALQLEASVSHKITIRYRGGLTAKHRLKFGARVMNIRSVIDIEERHKWLEILAEQGVAT